VDATTRRTNGFIFNFAKGEKGQSGFKEADGERGERDPCFSPRGQTREIKKLGAQSHAIKFSFEKR